ncbi:MAG: exopolyphosphatase [Bacteroidota bacterium]|nr:exopolyphosphatase [Bacteroidota bacterium]MCA6442958.1 exopolyphosphatase [Bacteroidota bacterium]
MTIIKLNYQNVKTNIFTNYLLDLDKNIFNGKKMRLAVIDCGTNTFNLLVVEVNGNEFKKIIKTRIPVKLGENTINVGYINEAAYQRGQNALAEFKTICNELKVYQIHAFATSAIRDANNGAKFTNDALIKFNITIQTIDGNKEAELIYYGNRLAAPLSEKVSLIMDIGGGSNEYILCTRDQILWKQSFKLGAARLIDKFKPENPLKRETELAMLNYLNLELSDLFKACAKYQPTELVGSSGAFDSIIEMIHGELNGEPFTENQLCYDVTLDNFKKIYDRVLGSTIEERKNIKGLIEMRVDMIVISCILIQYTLSSLNINKLRVSTYSLKEGALYQLINS